MSNVTQYTSKNTGKAWKAYQGIFFDCHTVAVAQVLPQEFFQPFMLLSSLCTIDQNWGGLGCRSALSSEGQRDVILFEQLGVQKSRVSILGNVEATIQETIREHGHCICRMDAYYHPYFDEFYQKTHRPGHKSTIIDWDRDAYYAMDSVGTSTFLMKFERELFLESVYSNLFELYDKEDSFFYLQVGELSSLRLRNGEIRARVEEEIRDFVDARMNMADALRAYADVFSTDLSLAKRTRRREAQIRNSYMTALQIEVCYTALLEAFRFDEAPWRAVVAGADRFMEHLEKAMKGWRIFKMLCRALETSEHVENRQAITALMRLVSWENELRGVSE